MRKTFLLLFISVLTLNAFAGVNDSLEIKKLQTLIAKQDTLINKLLSRNLIQDTLIGELQKQVGNNGSITSLNNEIVIYTAFGTIIITFFSIWAGFLIPKDLKKKFKKRIKEQSEEFKTKNEEFEKQNKEFNTKNEEFEKQIKYFLTKVEKIEMDFKKSEQQFNKNLDDRFLSHQRKIKRGLYQMERNIIILHVNAMLKEKNFSSVFVHSIRLIVLDVMMFKELQKMPFDFSQISSYMDNTTFLTEEQEKNLVKSLKMLNKIKIKLEKEGEQKNVEELLEKTQTNFKLNLNDN